MYFLLMLCFRTASIREISFHFLYSMYNKPKELYLKINIAHLQSFKGRFNCRERLEGLLEVIQSPLNLFAATKISKAFR